MAPKTVSAEEHLSRFLHKIAEEHKFETSDMKITPIPTCEDGTNIFKIKVAKDSSDVNLFAKISLNENIRDHQLYKLENEILFYDYLAKIYTRLEEKHGLSEKERIKVPTFYGAEATPGREILVLEDLTGKGFGKSDRFMSVDWAYAASALTELAKFHALSIAFRHENPEEFEKLAARFRVKGFFEKNDVSDRICEGMVSTALPAIREDKRELVAAFFRSRDFVTYFNDLFEPFRCNVILHADFRPDNMMHKVMKDGTTEVIPFNYQTIQLGSPAIDLYYFIFTATDAEFRVMHYKRMISHYHAELGVALARFGLKVEHEYPNKDFKLDRKERGYFCIMTTILFLASLLTSEDQIPPKGDTFISLATHPRGELYTQRINGVIGEYIIAGLF